MEGLYGENGKLFLNEPLAQVGVAADLRTLEVVLQQMARRVYGPVLSALLRVQEAH